MITYFTFPPTELNNRTHEAVYLLSDSERINPCLKVDVVATQPNATLTITITLISDGLDMVTVSNIFDVVGNNYHLGLGHSLARNSRLRVRAEVRGRMTIGFRVGAFDTGEEI